ncbi:MAG TPA: ABC transporter permease [Ramlibacter sp.]|jgi:lipopolysaccharide transport system permease protein|nr:ABC transporter permease [Ramlibacter sp.]
MTFLGFDRRDATTTWNFFRMFLRDRFLGSRLGTVWAVLNPIMMLGIYTYVFGFLFKARLPGADTTLAFSTWLIAGYGPWLAISEGLNSAAQSVTGNVGLVKNMAFKTECLPIAASLLGLVPLGVSVVFCLVLMSIDGNVPTWHAIAAIPGILLIFAFLAAVGLGLAVLTVFVRDTTMILPNVLMMILFASPIFYPLDVMPGILARAAEWNPFYLLSQFIREPVMFHRIPPLSQWVYATVLITVIGLVNLTLFRRLKGSLSSML